MIYPFINCKKVITSMTAPYEHFKRIERLDLNEKIINKYNLVSSLEATDPLTIKFRNQRNRFNKMDPKYFSSAVMVTFYITNNSTNIYMVVKSSLFYHLLCAVLLISVVSGALFNGLERGALGAVVLVAVAALFDLIAKRNILGRVESIVK